MSNSERSGGGGIGCFSLVLFCILVWFLLFGVTVGGVHYGMSCDTTNGVMLENWEDI